ncbi:MAG TPA: DUF4388 domain-containing protein [Nannocystaceae bacterium]|nr:DUF4388 domain-containing protein [Nannocystaceae bacterium]
MVTEEHPVVKLAALAEERCSGELVATWPTGETHLYLHRGRLAWAIDSHDPDGFARHLQDTSEVVADTLREVVDECRRARLPLGETLVAWGLVSTESLRLALRRQIHETVTRLAREPDCVSLFLARGWASYDAALTFGLDEIGGAEPVTTAAPPAAMPSALARRVRTSVEGVQWVEVIAAGALIDSDPPFDNRRTPWELIERTLSDSAELVALQGDEQSIVGARLSEGRTLWCCLAQRTTLGGVFFVLSSLTASDRSAAIGARPRALRPEWRVGDDDVLAQLAAHHTEIEAALVIDADDRVVSGLGYDGIAPRRCEELARARRRALLVGHRAGTRASIVTAEREAWCCGTVLANGSSLWLLLDRGTPQGLGWTLIAALARAWAPARVEPSA